MLRMLKRFGFKKDELITVYKGYIIFNVLDTMLQLGEIYCSICFFLTDRQ